MALSYLRQHLQGSKSTRMPLALMLTLREDSFFLLIMKMDSIQSFLHITCLGHQVQELSAIWTLGQPC